MTTRTLVLGLTAMTVVVVVAVAAAVGAVQSGGGTLAVKVAAVAMIGAAALIVGFVLDDRREGQARE